MEIRTFWSRKAKVSFAMVVFFVGRYCTLFLVLLSIAYVAPGDPPDILYVRPHLELRDDLILMRYVI